MRKSDREVSIDETKQILKYIANDQNRTTAFKIEIEKISEKARK